MPMISILSGRVLARAATAGAIGVVLLLLMRHTALAQGAFGVGSPMSAPPEAAGGLVGWFLQKQAAYYREFAALVRAAKQTGGVAFGLLGVAFSYGVFHAAGPGHGKAVISSYLFANGESWRRGVTLSFASALLQSLVAIAIVGIAAVLLSGTAQMMGAAVHDIEIGSFLLVIAVGLRLAWVKGYGFLAALRAYRAPAPASLSAAAAEHRTRAAHEHDHAHDDDHDHHHGHHDHDHHAAAPDGACPACGHAHGPAPQDLAGPGGWRRGLSAVLAAGLRPCSGAIILLVFTLAQGVIWTGVAATFAMGIGTAITVAALATFAVGARSAAARLAGDRRGVGLVALRTVELVAALAVILVGVLLLTGYMASERMFLV